ncbi:(d)CMP kinase [Agaribacterium haliotis]|uniref:(d)CMP kinase n=1 Tax=Agaribacterium haliotis TaxID=2013869 RepID=UPI000BB5842E|nr:(d)CMP kinase [Agaribacterium haliotis]
MALICIDGPSGAGKGTIARLLADKLGYALLDSGAIYRIAALAALKHGCDLNDEAALVSLAAALDIEFKIDAQQTQTLLNGEDVSKAIREEQTGMAASTIAALPALRQALLERQRAFNRAPGLIADGRDMGTVVFPEAEYKFFLTASAEERARRRVLQLQQSGANDIDQDKILADIKARDDRDMNRATAPLKPAADAELIDSTELSIVQVLDVITSKLTL